MRLAALASVALLLATAPAFAAGEDLSGKWSRVIGLPLVPSSGAVLPNGKVLLWSADGEFNFGGVGRVHTTLFDPASETGSYKVVEIGHNMFCTGTTNLPDGRILVNGGSQSEVTSIYDPATNTFRRVQNMSLPRGYNSNTILQDGSVFTLGGSWSGPADGIRDGEVWTETGGWRRLTGVTTQSMRGVDVNGNSFSPDSHMWLIPGGNGRVLYAGPAPAMQWIDTNGAGSVREAGRRGDDAFAVSGTAVMYDTGKIMKTGGGPAYGNIAASSATYGIDISRGATVTKLTPMTYARAFHNSVVLPDGKVMIVGGQSYAVGFSDNDSVLATEIWDPATAQFRVTAPVSVPRNYHSIALLLPDARVLSAGGGLCGTCTTNHPDLQIYSPGYLFDAAGNPKPRPAIVSAPGALAYGRSVAVTTDRDVASFALIRIGSTTHTVNNDQRRLALSFSRTGTNTYSVAIPSNAGYLLPGQWMLFAMDAAGTPSVAKVVTVAPNAIARLTAPEPIVTTVGGTVSVQPAIAVLGSGVTFGGTGLPPGVGVHPQSGAITGTPTTVGSYTATLTASNASGTVSTDFTVSVDPAPGNGNGLLAHYFANTTVSGTPVLTRRETPFFDYGTGGPGGGVPASNYSVRWSGQLLAQRTGSTRFRTNSDDGVRLWIGGRLVVDDWTDHPPTLAEGQVDLVAGRSYPVLLEYYNAGGGAVMQLSWSRPGDTGFAAIPVQQLSGPAALPATNLAVGKAAKQSSTYSPAVASRAVDGNTNGAFGAGSLSHTNSQANAWWQVDLGASRAIDRIRLWNRTDCCGDRLRNFHVLMSASDMTGRTLSALLADPAVIKRSVGAAVIPSNIDIQGGATARYVRVQLAGTNALQLAEVEVFGTAANRAPQITAPAAQASSAGLPVSLQIAASDPDGDALTFSATGLPPGLSINASGLISGTPTTGGSYSGTVTVRDPGGLSASTALSWSVVASAPSVTRLDVAPAAPGATVTYAPVVANDTGATYRWSYGDGVTETDFTASPGRTHVFAAPGIYGVTLTLRAASGQQSTYRFDQTITAPVAANGGGRSSGGLAFEARSGQSARLWIANPDNDSVGVIDLSTNARVAEIAVGRKPVSVALSPAGEVWVVNRESATISVVNPATLTVARTVALPPASRPYGLVFVPSSNSAIVTLEATEQVARIYYSGAFGGALSIGPSPRFLAVNGAENRIWVSRFVTPPLPGESTATVRTTDAAGNPVGGEVVAVTLNGTVERTIVLRHSEAADTEVSARGIPNYLGAVAFSPDGKSAWVPSKQDNVKRGVLRDGQGLDFQTSVRAIVSRIDVATGREDPAARVDLDNAGVASAAAFHPTGAWLFVALQTSRQVAVVDPVGKRELFRFGVGRAPSSLALSPDGRTLYVGNFMDRTVSVIGLSPLIDAGQKTVTVLATVPTIGTEKMPAAVVQGKKLFYDAADPRLARDGYLSCAACHDDAEADGRTWDFTGFGEGLRNTISLAGRAGIGHGFLHWSANFDEVQDFEGQIRNFAGGEGLMSNAAFNAGTRSQPLGDRKAGQSADLDALAAYLASRTTVPESPWRTTSGALTAAGTAGKAAFTRLGCATCHAGAKMTVSADASALKSIGTIKPESGKRLGGPLTGIDVPTLLGVFATAPYLHDGSAATLEQAVRAHQGIAVTATDMANLVAYLGQIGSTP